MVTIYPCIWAEDAISRDLDIGTVVRETTRTVHLEQTREQIEESLSDALYYSSEWKHMDMGRFGRRLGASATRAAARAKKALASVAEGEG